MSRRHRRLRGQLDVRSLHGADDLDDEARVAHARLHPDVEIGVQGLHVVVEDDLTALQREEVAEELQVALHGPQVTLHHGPALFRAHGEIAGDLHVQPAPAQPQVAGDAEAHVGLGQRQATTRVGLQFAARRPGHGIDGGGGEQHQLAGSRQERGRRLGHAQEAPGDAEVTGSR